MATSIPTTTERPAATAEERRAPSVARAASRGHVRPTADSEARTNDVAMQKLLERMEQLETANLSLRKDLLAVTCRHTELVATAAVSAAAVEGTIRKLFEELQEEKEKAFQQASKLKELEAASKTHRHSYNHSGRKDASGTSSVPK